MIRRIEYRDRADFLRMSSEFYASPAVLHDIPASRHEAMFEELMKGSPYADGYMLEADDRCVGYGITAKTYSREAGGMGLWLGAPFILADTWRRGRGRANFAFVAREVAGGGYCSISL